MMITVTTTNINMLLCRTSASRWRIGLKGGTCIFTSATATTAGHHQGTKQWLSISRMLDMGGMPSASNDQSTIRTVNASKNSKLQVVAFEFGLLTKSFDQHSTSKGQHQQQEHQQQKETTTEGNGKLQPVQPDLDHIQQVASLLKVNVDAGKKETTPSSSSSISFKSDSSNSSPSSSSSHEDIRAKYASKLKGGLAGIELAKSQVDDTLKGGDAAGHLAARQMAIRETAASPSKWMALTGTGKLLSYLTHRSIRIALLPNPNSIGNVEQQRVEKEFMDQFAKQLKDVVIDAVIDLGIEGNNNDSDNKVSIERALKDGVLKQLEMSNPNLVLLVTDRDEYLRPARDMGMITCRLQPKNARRGNVTAHYNVPAVPDVQEVVNEINGISFNAVLNR